MQVQLLARCQPQRLVAEANLEHSNLLSASQNWIVFCLDFVLSLEVSVCDVSDLKFLFEEVSLFLFSAFISVILR
jgi:hypothetical protein